MMWLEVMLICGTACRQSLMRAWRIVRETIDAVIAGRRGFAGSDRKRKGPAVGLLLPLTALVLVVPAQADTSDRFAMGGWYERFAPAIAQANATGELFRIRGHCQSNCTLFLGLRNVCVERSAQLLFHAGHGRGPERTTINAQSTQRMLNAYNLKLRRYVVANGYLATLDFSTISGTQIIDEFGYKECPPE